MKSVKTHSFHTISWDGEFQVLQWRSFSMETNQSSNGSPSCQRTCHVGQVIEYMLSLPSLSNCWSKLPESTHGQWLMLLPPPEISKLRCLTKAGRNQQAWEWDPCVVLLAFTKRFRARPQALASSDPLLPELMGHRRKVQVLWAWEAQEIFRLEAHRLDPPEKKN